MLVSENSESLIINIHIPAFILIALSQKSYYIKLKKADRGKQSFSKLTGSGSEQISARIRPEPNLDLFFQIQIRLDPEPDYRSGRSLLKIYI